MKFRLQRACLVCGFFVAATLLACLGEWRGRQTFDHALGRTLVIATTHEPASLHPVFGASGLADVEIMGALFEPLTVYDDRRRLVPCLALEVPSFENGGLRLLPEKEAKARGGRMESRWRLRPDARWSDGTPVTADDFVFTWQLARNPNVPAVSRELEDRIARMESADGGRTLIVLWKRPYAFAHEGHRHLLIPRHIEEPQLRSVADEKEYERTPFNRQPLGNGPYQMEEWAFGRHLALRRNPHWHGPEPFFERIVYRFIPEPETILANLDTGRLDAVSPVALDHDLAFEYHQRGIARRDATYVVNYQPGLWWEHIDFNIENPLTKDKRVRQALAAGLDRRGICATLFPGQDCVTDTWLPPLHPAAFPGPGRISPDLPRYPHDPDRARRLLDDAGWHVGPGQLRSKDGRVLRLTLAYQAGEMLLDRVAQMAKESWRQLGVQLDLLPMDQKSFDESTSGNSSFQGLSLYPWIMDPSADGMTFWTSDSIPTAQNLTGQNFCRWRSPTSDALLRRATETLDAAARRDLLWQQQRIWADELPAIPLFFHDEISIHHHRLSGWRPTGTETPITWNCAEWHWATD